MTTMRWTQEEDAFLRASYNLKLRASEIAKNLPHRSRNAILGYMFRNNIKLFYHKAGEAAQELEIIRRKKRNSKKRKLRKKKETAMIYKEPESFAKALAETITMSELDNTKCSFPIIGDDGLKFCGKDIDHMSYCNHHARICYSRLKANKANQPDDIIEP